MPEVLVLQHMACEPLGVIEDALSRNGLSYRYLRLQEGDSVPSDLGAAVGLIVLGGPMGVNDQQQYPFLVEELRLIALALSQEVPILGVCLGAQLLAFALGAAVRQSEFQEIGWEKVSLALPAAEDPLWRGVPNSFMGFHWHGDFFETPPGAILLASSAQTPCQAFQFDGFAYGFQCHLEVTEAIIRAWTTEFADELTGAGLDAVSILEGIGEHLPPMQNIARKVFGRWATMAAQRI